MDKILNILSQLQTRSMSREITEADTLSNKISEFVDVYQKNFDEFKSKSDEIEKLKNEEISLYKKITDREKEFAETMKELEDLQSELDCLSKFECCLDGTENTDLKMQLHGIKIESQYVDQTICQVKISFMNKAFVLFNFDIAENSYDLQAMEPKLRHYEELREFLLESGDIAGFLCHVWKYFSHKM